jgi:hypothetical protein
MSNGLPRRTLFGKKSDANLCVAAFNTALVIR